MVVYQQSSAACLDYLNSAVTDSTSASHGGMETDPDSYGVTDTDLVAVTGRSGNSGKVTVIE